MPRAKATALFGALIGLGLFTGCMSAAGAGAGSPGAGAPATVKKVVAKRPPHDVLAEDGSVCQLAEDRQQAVKLGERLHCAWRKLR